MFDGKVKNEDAIAFFRFSVISPMLDAPKGKVNATAKKLAKMEFNDLVNKRMVTFHSRTIYTYYMNYKKHGFDGLKPKRYKNKGRHPSVADETIKAILELKEELPSRSAQKIVTMLELAAKVEKDALNIRTVNRILKHYGYTKKELKNSSRVYTKHEKDKINKMWQSDVMSAFYLPDDNGKQRICYLIGFIEDHSRVITHAQFYFDATLSRLEDCLKKAVIKYGSPDSLYLDNGQIYISNDFKLICARLGIKVKYSRPYKPQGKGKIEKYWQYVQSSFLSEIKLKHVSNIIELNDLFSAWLKAEYHDKVHASLEGATPIERWNASLDAGTKLRYFSPVQIDQAFLHYAERVVNKYGVISFDGNQYAVDGTLVNKKVSIRYNPFHLDTVHLYYQDKYYGLARIIDLKKEKHKSVNAIQEDPMVDSRLSKEYFAKIKSNYQDYLKKQLNSPLKEDIHLNDITKETKPGDDEEDNDKVIVPTEKTQVLKRKEFVEIITAALDLKNLSFAEKGKLYELWQTFKEFNKEILIDIVNDIKVKTPDFNDNFLFYLAQIKNIYLEKSKGGFKND